MSFRVRVAHSDPNVKNYFKAVYARTSVNLYRDIAGYENRLGIEASNLANLFKNGEIQPLVMGYESIQIERKIDSCKQFWKQNIVNKNLYPIEDSKAIFGNNEFSRDYFSQVSGNPLPTTTTQISQKLQKLYGLEDQYLNNAVTHTSEKLQNVIKNVFNDVFIGKKKSGFENLIDSFSSSQPRDLSKLAVIKEQTSKDILDVSIDKHLNDSKLPEAIKSNMKTLVKDYTFNLLHDLAESAKKAIISDRIEGILENDLDHMDELTKIQKFASARLDRVIVRFK